MYLPSAFEEKDTARLHAFIRQAPFATLVTLTGAGLIASHLPLLLDAGRGVLIGHLASPNPQGSQTRTDVEALAIFQGPHAYITPSWYATKHETGRVVPTWNYMAVHAYGRLRFFNDPDSLLDVVTRLTEQHEAGRPQPWTVSDAPADFVATMLRGIVGFELAITRLEGKAKMSQNRPEKDRAGVVDGLMREGREDVAALVREYATGR